MLDIGAKAPAFRLPDHDGNEVSLRDLAGRWIVLYFYPRDDTPGCTKEACEFTAAMPDFRGLGAEVFGCSADSAAAHLKFIAKYSLGIRLLTDADKQVMRAYGAYGQKVMYGKQVEGVIRSTVLIDPAGRIAAHWPKVKAEGHAEQVRQKLQALQGGGGAVITPAPASAAKSRAAKSRAVKSSAPKSPRASAPKATSVKKAAGSRTKVAARPVAKSIAKKAAAKPSASGRKAAPRAKARKR